MKAHLLCCFFLVALLAGCSGDPAAEAPLPPVEVPVSPTPEAPGLSNDDKLYPWVDGVNVRDRPNTSGKRVARVLENEELIYLGEKSSQSETLVLRGVAYQEAWYKVKTKEGAEGWIFGGTVREAEEKKGNPEISSTKLAFPYFGRYDLSEWEKLTDEAGEEGDAEFRNMTYRKDGQTMKINLIDVGEYGYTQTYMITDVEDRVILERELTFTTDPDLDLVETVTNNLQSPSETYTRSQRLAKHPSQLNAQPVMVNGEWRKVE